MEEILSVGKEWTPSSIVIPVELVYNPLITNTDKTIFGLIQNLAKRSEGCTCSNSILAQMAFVKEQTITNAVHILSLFQYIIVEYNKKSYPFRRIFLNPEREHIYKELVNTYHDNFRKNSQIPNNLQDTLSKIVKKIMKKCGVVLKEDTINKTMPVHKNIRSNNISNIIHSSLHSSSSENKFSSSSIHVIEEYPDTDVSGIDTGDFQSVHKQLSTVGKGLSDESHLPPKVINSSLQKDAPRPAPDRTVPVAAPNKGLLRRRVLIGLEKIKAKSIEERFINATARVESKSEKIRAKSIEVRAKKKELEPFQPSKDVKEIFDYWIECGFKLPGETTKGIRDASKRIKGLLKGTLFPNYKQPFTMEQIKLNITRFQIMAFNNDYKPVELAKKKRLQDTSLYNFIENSWAKNDNGDKSYFLTCHKHEPELVKSLVPDPSPGLTKALKEIFAKEICAGRKPEKYSVHEENCFREATD
ncbi:MAG: hypothetical protein ABIA11_03805, partial [Patescibacteria group bacterium]